MSFLESVTDALARQTGEPPQIDGLERAAFAKQSSYRIEILTLHAADRVERIFLKDFGSCKHEKEDMEDRRTRELRIYREFLAPARLGTPEYRGSVWDESRHRFWLLLEYVEGKRVRDLGFGHWLDAARWLGTMQGRFAHERLSARSFLVEHGQAFYWSVAERALQAVGTVAPGLARRLEAALRTYDEPVAVMASGPTTFVHGVYRPYNILVRSADEAHAICPTDWEEGARGSPLYDLAYLSDGFERARLDLLIDAYERGLAGAGLRPPDRDDALRLLRCLYVHRNLKTLSKASSREGFSPEGLEGLVSRTEELMRDLS
jgi:hypothetical protein